MEFLDCFAEVQIFRDLFREVRVLQIFIFSTVFLRKGHGTLFLSLSSRSAQHDTMEQRNKTTWVYLILIVHAKIGLAAFEPVASRAGEGRLLTTLCVDRCLSDCQSYQTRLSSCYNGQMLFPGDDSWGEFDIWDKLLTQDEFRRSFFQTQNGTCAGVPTDVFSLPLDECVGPFGEPRPWGRFSCISCSPINAILRQ